MISLDICSDSSSDCIFSYGIFQLSTIAFDIANLVFQSVSLQIRSIIKFRSQHSLLDDYASENSLTEVNVSWTLGGVEYGNKGRGRQAARCDFPTCIYHHVSMHLK